MSIESSFPGGLPLFPAGWGAGRIPFGDAETFWDDATRMVVEGALDESLDLAMAGKSSPRVWLFLHEPGEGQLSVAAALSVARELAQRDQAVLLLDGDDEEASLTGWAGRRDQDGWIDFVRYGSSVLACGVPMPFEGRRAYLLGVGSFTPVDASGDEIADLLGRLKRQADDILVVAPANSVGRLWAAAADLRLLCWDRAQRSAGLVEAVAESFDSAGIPLTALVGFGLPEDGSHETDVLVSEDDEAPQSASVVLDRLEDQLEDDFLDEEEFARRKGNSGVFWLVAVASVVMISMVSVYYLKYVRVPAEGNFPSMARQEVHQSGVASFDSGLTALSPEIVIGSGEDVLAEEHSLPVGGEAEGEVALGLSDSENVSAENGEVVADSLLSEVNGLVPEPVVESVIEPEVIILEDSFGMSAYMAPVGSGGWTLHVYSFPDSLQAEAERSILAAKGFRTATRAVEFKDKGRWYRLYLGSFKTKTEAQAARSTLMEKLGEDWANPVRF